MSDENFDGLDVILLFERVAAGALAGGSNASGATASDDEDTTKDGGDVGEGDNDDNNKMSAPVASFAASTSTPLPMPPLLSAWSSLTAA